MGNIYLLPRLSTHTHIYWLLHISLYTFNVRINQTKCVLTAEWVNVPADAEEFSALGCCAHSHSLRCESFPFWCRYPMSLRVTDILPFSASYYIIIIANEPANTFIFDESNVRWLRWQPANRFMSIIEKWMDLIFGASAIWMPTKVGSRNNIFSFFSCRLVSVVQRARTFS